MLNESAGAYETLMQFLYRAPIGLVQTTLDGTIEMINPMSASLLMPLSRDGDLDNLFVALEQVAPQLRKLVGAYESSNGAVCDSLRIVMPVGGESDAATQILSISLLKLDEARLMAMVSDVTQEVRREESGLARQLDAAARTDALTQMPNRAVVRELIQQAIGRARAEPSYEFAILFMNCDRFKQINDSLGHSAGDEVLGLMADRLRATLRLRNRGGRTAGNEPMAGRLGGDEFVVLLDDLRSAEEVHSVAQRLLDVLSQPYSVLAQQLHFTASMGVVLRTHVTGDADAALQDSSIAMVEAKRAGGARYTVFEPSMRERAARRSGIESDLRRALLENQLFVVYQPVVALQISDGIDCPPAHAAGVEALVRWRHPTRGVVPPIEFIGIAEECGLIGPLGEFVLSTACHQFVEWQRKLGRLAPRLLAVNLSRGQLGDSSFVDVVGRTLRSSGMQAANLQLEVTESLAAQDESVQTRLQELKALGLSLALDDFGTGYSSLASLHQLPVGTVKIDRSFVSEAVSSAHHRVLIEATVRVAQSLGMGTVAEGIETQAQADLVKQLGCDKGQGYIFSRPLSAADLVLWLTSKGGPKASRLREWAEEKALPIS
jgi:diguanylate cyclase (GGDEF)-like protein